MKKIILLSACLISLSAFSMDTTKVDSEKQLTEAIADSLLNDFTGEASEMNLRTTPAQDSVIVQHVDIVVRAVASVIPQAAPFTSLIGIIVTGIGYLLLRRKWRRRHEKEIEALTKK